MIFQERLDAIDKAYKERQEAIEARKQLVKQLNNLGVHSDMDLVDELFKAIDAYAPANGTLKEALKEAVIQWQGCANSEGFDYI